MATTGSARMNQVTHVVTRSRPVVSEVLSQSPADSAGVRAGDTILAIDGFDTVQRTDSARIRRTDLPTLLTVRRGSDTLNLLLIARVETRRCVPGR